jgi:sulfate adenylyltransferase subunit 2
MQNATSGRAPEALGLDAPRLWDTESAFEHLRARGEALTRRTAERRLHALGLLAPELDEQSLLDELGRPVKGLLLDWAIERARAQRKRVLFVQWFTLASGKPCLQFNDARGGRFWRPFAASSAPLFDPPTPPVMSEVAQAFTEVRAQVGKDLALFPHGELVRLLRGFTPPAGVELHPAVYPPVLQIRPATAGRSPITPHLARLEAESIHIMREAVAEADNPVMLYSIGKDSSVMLHLARKAFHPSPPPFPLLHVDTRWKFREMYLFRDHVATLPGIRMIVHENPEIVAKNINPFDHGSSIYIGVTKIEGLKQAIDQHRFDVMFGGARRDEEKSRAKERIFSFRSASHRWDPKQQRPELWNLYNVSRNKGESIRVFPLSNWTELDVWQYIHHEQIPIVPLYFAKSRPVVVRGASIIMVDDERFRLLADEPIQEKGIRFRSLGCYPLTGAIESQADSVEAIMLELIHARRSERQGRMVDHESPFSMEKKKQEGHF